MTTARFRKISASGKSRSQWLVWMLGWIGFLGLVSWGISLLIYSDFSFLIFLICAIFGVLILSFFVLGFVFSLKHQEIHWKVLRRADIACLLFLVVNFVYGLLNPVELRLLNDMSQNYDKHQKEIQDLVNYTRNACDTSCFITIEWDNDGLDRFHVQPDGQQLSSNWEVSDAQRDSLMALVGMTQAEFEIIRKKLKACNCIWLETNTSKDYGGEYYSSLGYKRDGLAAYAYYILDTIPPDTLLHHLSESPNLIPYTETVFFQYLGGAIGREEFPTDIKKRFL